MRTITLSILMLLCISLHAQDDIRLFKPNVQPSDSVTRPSTMHNDGSHPGVVTVVESDRIKALMADYTARKRPLDGYRVQVFLGDRSQAESIRRTFLLQHPDIPAYLSYLAPNFRIRVGDLRDRVEAEAMRENLRIEFPGLYVVPDQIEPPRLTTQPN